MVNKDTNIALNMALYFEKDLKCGACGNKCQKGCSLWVWGRWKAGCWNLRAGCDPRCRGSVTALAVNGGRCCW